MRHFSLFAWAFCGVAAAVAPAAALGQEPEWMRDYEAARIAARSAGKPMFVVIRCER
jgi:hypothetical protein